MIEIHYRTHRLQQICEDAGTAIKAYGEETARRIHMRIDQIGSADSVEQLVRYRIGRCHPLTGNRKGQYAVNNPRLKSRA